MTDEKDWEAIKQNSVFIMRGTIEDLCKQDLSHLARDGKEYIFAILYTQDK